MLHLALVTSLLHFDEHCDWSRRVDWWRAKISIFFLPTLPPGTEQRLGYGYREEGTLLLESDRLTPYTWRERGHRFSMVCRKCSCSPCIDKTTRPWRLPVSALLSLYDGSRSDHTGPSRSGSRRVNKSTMAPRRLKNFGHGDPPTVYNFYFYNCKLNF